MRLAPLQPHRPHRLEAEALPDEAVPSEDGQLHAERCLLRCRAAGAAGGRPRVAPRRRPGRPTDLLPSTSAPDHRPPPSCWRRPSSRCARSETATRSARPSSPTRCATSSACSPSRRAKILPGRRARARPSRSHLRASHFDRHVTRARWPRGDARRKMPPRPKPTSFAHNVRVALACAPALLLVLDVSGGSIAGIVALGTMLTYIFNVLGWQEVCIAAVWLTAAILGFRHAAGALAVLGATLRGVGLAALGASFAALLGLWAAAQPRVVCRVAARPRALARAAALRRAPGAVRAAPGLGRRRARRRPAHAGGAARVDCRRLLCALRPAARAPSAARRRRARGAACRARRPPRPRTPSCCWSSRRRATPRCTRPLSSHRGDPTRRRCWRCPRSPRWWWRRRRRRASAASMSAASAPSWRWRGSRVRHRVRVGQIAPCCARRSPSAVAIGCTLLRAAPTLRCVALLCHAVLLGFVELHLLAEDSAAAGDGGGAYPPWLVAATVGGVVLFVVERLHADDGRMAPPPVEVALAFGARGARGAARRAHWRRVAGGHPRRRRLHPAAAARCLAPRTPPFRRGAAAEVAPAVAVLRLTLLGWATLTALPPAADAAARRQPRPSPPIVTGRRRPLRRRRVAARRRRSRRRPTRRAKSLRARGRGRHACALRGRRHCPPPPPPPHQPPRRGDGSPSRPYPPIFTARPCC